MSPGVVGSRFKIRIFVWSGLLSIVVGGLLWLADENAPGTSNERSACHGRQPTSLPGPAPLVTGFESNRGQMDESVRFMSRGPGYTLYLTEQESVLVLSRPASESDAVTGASSKSAGVSEAPPAGTAIRMKLEGTNRRPLIEGLQPKPGKTNYIRGTEPSKWIENVPTFDRVRFKEVYPGVDLVYHHDPGQLEFDLILSPGADPDGIRLSFEGVERLEASAAGDLILHTPAGRLEQRKPFIYQEIAESRHEIPGGYVLRGENEVGFQVGLYSASFPLIIDPVIVYSSYLGGSGAENGRFVGGIAVDAAGQAYVTGSTESFDFPLADPLQNNLRGNIDAYVAKVSADGSSLVYCTYLGGQGLERGMDIGVDVAGSAYVTGRTQSSDFPTKHPLQPGLKGVEDAFVAKLAPDGSSLLYSTFLGGTNIDFGFGIAVSFSGRAFLLGATNSTNLSTPNAFQSNLRGAYDAFVARLDPSGSSLEYLTYLGGSGVEAPGDSVGKIAVDNQGNAYVAGATSSSDFPTRDPYQGELAGLFDAFLTKLNPSGSDLVYSTYLGGSGNDAAVSLALDSFGRSYLVGITDSTDFPLSNPLHPAPMGGLDSFVARFDWAASSLQYSTYIGGENEDIVYDIAVDAIGAARLTGTTTSLDFPEVNPLQDGMKGNRDAFLIKLNPSGDYEFSSFVGGEGVDYGIGVDFDTAGNTFILGRTASEALATAGAFQTRFAGETDAFIMKIADRSPGLELAYYLPQIADGTWESGSFRTTFIVINPNDESVETLLELSDDEGLPLPVKLPGLGTGSQFSMVLEPGSTRILQTEGAAELRVGAATVKTDRQIGVTAVFSLFDLSGAFVTEAGVGSSKPIPIFTFPVEVSRSLNTGVALFNPEGGAAELSLTLINGAGEVENSASLDLEGGHHIARFVGGVDGLFPSVSDFRGTLNVVSSPPVAAVALRQTSLPVLYTSLPVVDQRSIRKAFNLPQIAEGSYAQGAFHTSFLLFNNWVTPATASISLSRDDGSPLAVSFDGSDPDFQLDVTIPRNGASFIQTGGDQPLTAGAATVRSDVPMGVAAIFSVNNVQGRLVTEAGVGDSAVVTDFTVPVDTTNDFDTGVAFFNPGVLASTLDFRLLDSTGESVAVTSRTLGESHHLALFVTELFPGVKGFRGSMTVKASVGVAALTLRQHSNPLSYTTLPVVKGSAGGN